MQTQKIYFYKSENWIIQMIPKQTETLTHLIVYEASNLLKIGYKDKIKGYLYMLLTTYHKY